MSSISRSDSLLFRAYRRNRYEDDHRKKLIVRNRSLALIRDPDFVHEIFVYADGKLFCYPCSDLNAIDEVYHYITDSDNVANMDSTEYVCVDDVDKTIVLVSLNKDRVVGICTKAQTSCNEAFTYLANIVQKLKTAWRLCNFNSSSNEAPPGEEGDRS